MSRCDWVSALVKHQKPLRQKIKDVKAVKADNQNTRENPLRQQVGGDHYREGHIQPVEYIESNNLGFLEGCVIKRVTRHNRHTGKGVQDIDKAIHELQLLKFLRYGEK